MKSIYFFLVVGLLAIFSSCSKEPKFPDPGIDDRMDLHDTVRVDTIDRYTISMNVSAPNGIRNILILNAYSYDVVDDISSQYIGQTKFTMNYSFDLKNITRDTTINYIIKFIDTDMRSFNRGFTLVVKKKSEPTVTTIGNKSVLGVVSKCFEFKALFETGINMIKSYKVEFGEQNQILDEKVYTENFVNTLDYKLLCNLDMQENKDYNLNITLEDDKGISTKTTFVVRLVKAKLPHTILFTEAKLFKQFFLRYNSDNLVSSYEEEMYVSNSLKTYLTTFEYNKDKMLTRILRVGTSAAVSDYKLEIVINYDAQNRIVSVVNPYKSAYDALVDSYNADGSVQTFRVGTNPTVYGDINYVKDYADNKPLLNEYWGGNKADKYRLVNADMLPVVIPTHIPSYPFITAEASFWADFQILFQYKYVSLKVVNKMTNQTVFTRSYQQDASGQMTVLKVGAKTYTFLYNRE